MPPSLQPLVDGGLATMGQLEGLADSVFKIVKNIAHPSFLRDGPLRPFIRILLATELRFYPEMISTGENQPVTQALLAGVLAIMPKDGPSADLTLRRWSGDVAARFAADNLHLADGGNAGLAGSLAQVTSTVQLALASVTAATTTQAEKNASLTAMVARSQSDVLVLQGQVSSLLALVKQLATQLQRRGGLPSASSSSAAAAVATSAAARENDELSSLELPSLSNSAASGDDDIAAGAADASAGTSAASPSTDSSAPASTMTWSIRAAVEGDAPGMQASLKGMTAAEVYRERKTGSLQVLSKQDKARVVTAVKCMDRVASPQQHAAITASGAARDEGAAIRASIAVSNMLRARLAAAHDRAGLKAPKLKDPSVELLIGAIDGRLDALVKSGDAGAVNTFTTVDLTEQQRASLVPTASSSPAGGAATAKVGKAAAAAKKPAVSAAAAVDASPLAGVKRGSAGEGASGGQLQKKQRDSVGTELTASAAAASAAASSISSAASAAAAPAPATAPSTALTASLPTAISAPTPSSISFAASSAASSFVSYFRR